SPAPTGASSSASPRPAAASATWGRRSSTSMRARSLAPGSSATPRSCGARSACSAGRNDELGDDQVAGEAAVAALDVDGEDVGRATGMQVAGGGDQLVA